MKRHLNKVEKQEIGDFHTFFVCDDALRIKTISEYFQIGNKRLMCSIGDNDNLETKRRISQCQVVVAFIDEIFNITERLQYELAAAVLLGKNIAILIDGASLPKFFEKDYFFCILDIRRNPRWAESLRESILRNIPSISTIQAGLSVSRTNELLQFMWNIEQILIADPKLDVKSKDESTSEMMRQSGSDRVSHTFLCSLLTKSEENIAENIDQMPEEIKELCRRYQQMITKGHIRQIGRKLDLDNHHLDEVDGYFESGIPEMFWQLVKRWHAKYPNRVSARRLRKALQSCSVDTEETHMPKKHKDALHKMTQFLVDNIMDINIMMPLLISENILSDVTVAYVSAPSTLSQKIMRLLEVLTTKEHGLYMICDVFKKTDQRFIADRMIENLPELKEGRSKGSVPTVFTCPRSNSSSETSLKSSEKWMLINNKEVPIRGNGKVISNSAPALIETPRESDEHFYNNNYNAKVCLVPDGRENDTVMRSTQSPRKLCCVIL